MPLCINYNIAQYVPNNMINSGIAPLQGKRYGEKKFKSVQ